MTNLYRGLPSIRILNGSGAGLREKAVPGVTGGRGAVGARFSRTSSQVLSKSGGEGLS